MEPELDVRIEELLRLTETMFCLASEGAWDEVETCEMQRIAIIGSLAPFGNDTDSGVATKLRQALDRNAEIVTLVNVEKNRIADELMLSRRLEKADQAYRDIDAGSG